MNSTDNRFSSDGHHEIELCSFDKHRMGGELEIASLPGTNNFILAAKKEQKVVKKTDKRLGRLIHSTDTQSLSLNETDEFDFTLFCVISSGLCLSRLLAIQFSFSFRLHRNPKSNSK